MDRVYEKVETRYDKSLFTICSWITTMRYSSADTSDLFSVQKLVWNSLHKKIPEKKLNSMKDYYTRLENKKGHMFTYAAAAVALNTTEPPEMRMMRKELEDYSNKHNSNIEWISYQMDDLEEFIDSVRHFYSQYDIDKLYEKCKPFYTVAQEKYEQQVRLQIKNSMNYLKTKPEKLDSIQKIVIIPNLVGFQGEMGPTFRGIKFDVKGPRKEYVFYPHEFIHSLVNKLTYSEKYEQQIQAIAGLVWEEIEETPARRSYPDPIVYFDDCLVRTLDGIIFYEYGQGLNSECMKTIEQNVKRGFILCKPMYEAMQEYERQDKSFVKYFPEFIEIVDNSIRK